MPPLTDQIELNRLGLKPGGGARFEVAVRVGGFVFGDQRYAPAADPAPVLVDVSRTTTGFVMRVRAELAVEGPCMRCSDPFSLSAAIDHSEVHEPTLGEDLASEYVSGDSVDLAALVRDAVGLALPPSISGPLTAGGDCVACARTRAELAALGVRAADDAADDDEPHQPDPRWAKLRELEL